MNLVIGDSIEFTLAKFEGGSFYSRGGSRHGRSGKYVGDESFSGVIEKDWYDSNRRHWFSVRLDNGKPKKVQGKKLYPAISKHTPGIDHADQAEGKRLMKSVQV